MRVIKANFARSVSQAGGALEGKLEVLGAKLEALRANFKGLGAKFQDHGA